jgi:ActR/RegA family two-component response regulator
MVSAHGGNISARNQVDGVEFSIYLPARCVGDVIGLGEDYSTLPSQISEINRLNFARTAPTKGTMVDQMRTVLIVDDDPIYRRHLIESMQQLLTSGRWQPIEAGSYLEAVKLLRSEPNITHAVIDVDLGSRKTGLDVVKVANMEKTELNIIIHTNRHPASIETELLRLRYKDIMQKPLDVAKLRAFLNAEESKTQILVPKTLS